MSFESNSFAGSTGLGLQSLKNLACRLRDRVPARCVVCEAPAERHNLCELCRLDLPRLSQVCVRCALPVIAGTRCGPCLLSPPAWQSMTCAVPYETPYDTLIARLKFGGHQSISPALSALLCEALDAPRERSSFHPMSTASPHAAEVLIPVPLHWRRLWLRGFNQAGLIARHVSQQRRIPLYHALVRVRHTPAQTLLGARRRVTNLRDAFRVSQSVCGRHVALIDDVVTTCATVSAATRALLDANAASVRIWACARARGKHPRRPSGRA